MKHSNVTCMKRCICGGKRASRPSPPSWSSMICTGEIPLVLLFAMRAERNAPAWQIKTTADEEYGHRYTELVLRPLSDEDGNELINRLLANPELPDSLRSSILEKSGGNPFF